MSKRDCENGETLEFEWLTLDSARKPEYIKKYTCISDNREWLFHDPCLVPSKKAKGVLAISRSDDIAGYGFVTARKMIFSVYVFPEYRNRGLGSEIVKRCVECGGNFLQVEKTNKTVVEFYRKMGFEVVGHGKCPTENNAFVECINMSLKGRGD